LPFIIAILYIDDYLDTYLEVAARSCLMSPLSLNPSSIEGSILDGEDVVPLLHRVLPSLKSRLVYWEEMLLLVHTTVVEVQVLCRTPGAGPLVHARLRT
jgi:hypothetical protein